MPPGIPDGEGRHPAALPVQDLVAAKTENLPAPISPDAQTIMDHEKGWIWNPTLLVDTAKFGNIMPAMRESRMSHAVIWRPIAQLRPAPLELNWAVDW